jgi:hypothetical protein
MGGRAVTKKVIRRACFCDATPPSSNVTCAVTRRAQPRHRFLKQARELRSEIVRILALGDEIRRREDHRIVAIGFRHQRHGRGVRRRIEDRLGDPGAGFRLEDVVDELERVLRMRRAYRDGERILLPHGAFLRHDEVDVVVLLHDLGDVAVILHHHVDFARQQQILAVVLVEGLDVGLLLGEQILGLLQQFGRRVVQRVAEIFEAVAEQLARIRHDGDLAGIGVGIEQPLPAIGDFLDLRLAIADADHEPGIRQAVFAARIERRVGHELRRDVLDIGDLSVVQRLEQTGLDHALDKLAARNDDVVTGIAGTQLGEELVVGGEQAHIDLDAARLREIIERGLADISVPVVEIELGLLGGPGGAFSARQTDADGGGAEAFQN